VGSNMKLLPQRKALVRSLFLSVLALVASTLVGYSAGVDPDTVGKWELSVNGGLWVWEIHPNGTYEFHSEAADGVAPHAGKFAASGGVWSLQATNGYTDGGTYTFQPPDTLVATGHLGTASWRRLANLTNAAGDDSGITEPAHFVNETRYLKMPNDQRLSYVQGAFDGFLFGYEAAKSGWNIDWVTKCLDSMTAGALRDAADKDAKVMADLVFDGAPTSDGIGGASATYNGLLEVCKH
jgi:hypothetical protein